LEDNGSSNEDDKEQKIKGNSRNSMPRKTDNELAKQFIINSTNQQPNKVTSADPLNKYLKRSTGTLMGTDIKNMNLGDSPKNDS
jgi:hypothetical protein